MSNRDGWVIIAQQNDGLFEEFCMEVEPAAYVVPLDGDDWCLIPDAVVVDRFNDREEAEWYAEHGSYQIEGETIWGEGPEAPF